ncbi:MAG: TlpA family protein disulfide reductase [Candidatus Heimdallarchaeota archaeon]|nr:TlpA family protein disulfide reductase [Candidatus Heimdallarchaeota archaeon]
MIELIDKHFNPKITVTILMKKITIQFILVCMLILVSQSKTSAYVISGSFTTIDGGTVTYASFEGEYVFLEGFWTDCGVCETFHPVVASLYETYKNDLQFISVGVFTGSETLASIQNWVNERGGGWLFGLDDGNLRNTLSITHTPTSFLLDKAGIVLERWEGYQEKATIAYAIETYVKENSDATSPEASTSGGNGNDDSWISRLFTNPIFQAVMVIVVVFVVYTRIRG